MSTTGMKQRIAEASPRFKARITAIFIFAHHTGGRGRPFGAGQVRFGVRLDCSRVLCRCYRPVLSVKPVSRNLRLFSTSCAPDANVFTPLGRDGAPLRQLQAL
jgi:hypothetical protein